MTGFRETAKEGDKTPYRRSTRRLQHLIAVLLNRINRPSETRLARRSWPGVIISCHINTKLRKLYSLAVRPAVCVSARAYVYPPLRMALDITGASRDDHRCGVPCRVDSTSGDSLAVSCRPVAHVC